MLSNTRRMFLVPAIAVAICGWLVSSAVAASQFTGAIHTTNFWGTAVNQNHFTSKEAVFLNAGPQHKGGPQLPPGLYYFQVTDTSGRTLLSKDLAECRQVEVGSSGKITAVVPGAITGCQHLLGSDKYPGDPERHDKPVQLFDFDSSRNGTYKAWLIAQTGVVSGCTTTENGRFLNFTNSCTKTDNFKVAFQSQPACAAWTDNFDGSTLDPRWIKQSGTAPGSVPGQLNIGIFDPNYVTLEGGWLRLKLTQVLFPDNVWRSAGALVSTQVPCGYGTYEWTMRMGSTAQNDPFATGVNLSGGVSAGFTYYRNSEHEIVFEHSAHSAVTDGNGLYAPESIWFVNFHNLDPEADRDPLPEEGTATEQELPDVYEQSHHYKFVWGPGRITFYIDGVEKKVHDTNVPTVPGLFMISYFGRNFPLWGGNAQNGTRYFYVDSVSYTPGYTPGP